MRWRRIDGFLRATIWNVISLSLSHAGGLKTCFAPYHYPIASFSRLRFRSHNTSLWRCKLPNGRQPFEGHSRLHILRARSVFGRGAGHGFGARRQWRAGGCYLLGRGRGSASNGGWRAEWLSSVPGGGGASFTTRPRSLRGTTISGGAFRPYPAGCAVRGHPALLNPLRRAFVVAGPG